MQKQRKLVSDFVKSDRVQSCSRIVIIFSLRPNRSGWRLDRDMGLMNAIGLQPRHPAPSVTSQGTQTPIIQLQNAETQTERDLSEPSVSQPAPSTETVALIVPPILHNIMYSDVVTVNVL